MAEILPIVAQANAAFPNLEVEVQDDGPDRSITSRMIGRYPVTLLRSPRTEVEAIGSRSASAGLGHYLKLIWQLNGRMRYEDADRSFDIGAGDLIVTSMASDYNLVMAEEHEALILAFDPRDDARWSSLARDALAHPIEPGAGIVVAANGVKALLDAQADRTGELTARAMVDLALMSAQPDPAGRVDPEPALIGRAGLQILHHIADLSYNPARLARDLGMSRRSLYTRLTALGTTPSALIRRVRLERAHQDIVGSDARTLVEIAIANGFPDGASLSRAFRAVYGQPPSAMRPST